MNYELYEIEYVKHKERVNPACDLNSRQWYINETCWNCEVSEKTKARSTGWLRRVFQLNRKSRTEPAAKKITRQKLEQVRRNSF